VPGLRPDLVVAAGTPVRLLAGDDANIHPRNERPVGGVRRRTLGSFHGPGAFTSGSMSPRHTSKLFYDRLLLFEALGSTRGCGSPEPERPEPQIAWSGRPKPAAAARGGGGSRTSTSK
jgi:hypothetical protein